MTTPTVEAAGRTDLTDLPRRAAWLRLGTWAVAAVLAAVVGNRLRLDRVSDVALRDEGERW